MSDDRLYVEQLRREAERSLTPIAWLERNASGITDADLPRVLWRAVIQAVFPDCATLLADSDALPLAKLADAVEQAIGASRRGQPSTFVKAFRCLAELPTREKSPTAPEWGLIAYGLALRAMIERVLSSGRGFIILSAVDLADDYLNDEIVRRCRAEGGSPSELREATEFAVEFTRNWRRSADLSGGEGPDKLTVAMRTLVEFIAAYSGLFELHDKEAHRDADAEAGGLEGAQDEEDGGEDDTGEGGGEDKDALPRGSRGKGDLVLRASGYLRDYLRGARIDRLGMEAAHPMVVPPRDWEAGRRGGYLTRPRHLCKLHTKNAVVADLRQMIDRQDLPTVFEAVNALQRTAWRINPVVLATCEQVYHLAARDELPEELAVLRRRAARRSGALEAVEAGRVKRIGPVWDAVLGDLCGRAAFHFPYQLDYRGRLYPLASWLSPQGGDLAKGLLEFSLGKPVPPGDALRLLALHGSQLVATSRISGDLGLERGAAPSIADRERWVRMHEEAIIASAQTPLVNTWWSTSAKNKCRWQLLAFCVGWAAARRGEPCHLPVYVDGSCNGLQHMAALIRDRRLANYTNLLPGDRPRDTYAWVREAVEAQIGKAAAEVDNPQRLLAVWLQQHGLLDRDAAKAVVIGFSYGSDRYKDNLKDHLESLEASGDGSKPWWEAIADAGGGIPPKAVPAESRWWRDLFLVLAAIRAEGRIKNARYVAGWDPEEERREKADAPEREKKAMPDVRPKYRLPTGEQLLAWQGALEGTAEAASLGAEFGVALRNFMYDRLAAYMATYFDAAMGERLATPIRLREWLRKSCTTVVKETHLPLAWTSPVELPVVQIRNFNLGEEKREVSETTSFAALEKLLEGRGVEKRIPEFNGRRQVPVQPQPKNSVMSAKQASAFAPNLIHSLDAAHLMLTVCRGRQLGIDAFAAIHDSFGTRAADAPALALALRDSFMRLHREPILARLREWFELLRDPQLPAPVNLSPMQGELLAAWRQNWQANPAFGVPAAAPGEPLGAPPFNGPDDAFDIDEIAESKYIFY